MAVESDVDRLDYLETWGVCVRVNGQPFFAIFDNQFSPIAGEVDIETRVPQLACRTCDVERIGIKKDDPVDGLEKEYRVEHHEPDGTGMSVLVLKL